MEIDGTNTLPAQSPSRADSSLRRRSLPQLGDDTDSESVSEAGDIGDRALSSRRHSGSGRIHFLDDNVPGNNFVVPVQEEEVVHHGNKEQETRLEMPWLLLYISCLIHLAVWGILGVLTRYLLQKLFGPGVIGATSDQSYMYLDLPSNMVGSFLMGWLGVVFKANISKVSDHLAIGLTTGYLGSLTTFSGWNQKMLDLSVGGQWVFAVLGYFIGLFLVECSIVFGIETAKGFKWMLQKLTTRSKGGNFCSKSNSIVDNYKFHAVALILLILVLALLWCLSGVFEKREFSSGNSAAQLWLACMVGPFGVWTRWLLARLNGRGLGRNGSLRWVPFGTLIANVSAACIMAVLAVLKKAVKTQNFDTVASGLQFGLMGCLSTVSTFIAEFHAMRKSDQPWRAYAYAITTICISFCLGTLIYSVPVWIKGYD
ncbi:fluoride export protein 2 [Heracleum sosnowskyi]|uniref:Fluoride export protein 2 n=1 Tax=Heracleum sosnowskyi TaxID=360622 RepID=A0AAD8I438_9APIA|nr:fluoride export protein 2 [Heracleum sosnowskyi]